MTIALLIFAGLTVLSLVVIEAIAQAIEHIEAEDAGREE